MVIEQSTFAGLRELALFAGAGGGILGGHLLGWRTVCAVERDAYAASILAQRQNDGLLPPFPIWSDVTSFDAGEWRGLIDVVSGGFPCQDISLAGNGDGLDGERSGLWREFARILRELRPRFAYIENSPALTVRGLDRILCDLAALGFDAEWAVYLRPMLEPITNAIGSGFWSTPTTKDINQVRGEAGASNAPSRGTTLGGAVRKWPTPTATAHKGWSPNHNRAHTNARIDYTVEREAHEAGQAGRLSPMFCEWLMGWPIDWTALKPLETDRFREWQQAHSCNWQSG